MRRLLERRRRLRTTLKTCERYPLGILNCYITNEGMTVPKTVATPWLILT